MPRVSVVIPNWNGSRWLRPCLAALAAQQYRDFEVVIVDNGSTDGSPALVESLRAEHPDLTVQLVALTQNIGFAAGTNAGIRFSDSELVAALNNDTVADPGWLGALVDALDARPGAGFVASTMLSLSEPHVIDTVGDGYRWDGRAYKIGEGAPPGILPAEPFEVFGACAGAALYRRRMLDEIGLFDERYFAYMEDVDLSIRARIAGWSCYSVPGAVVLHAGAGSSGGTVSRFSVRLTTKNIFATLLKSVPGPLMPAMVASAMGTLCGAIVVGALSGRPPWVRPNIGALGAGLWAALGELPSSLRARRRTQSARRISSGDFWRLMQDSAVQHRRFRPPAA
jgi:GT2 family glycosyltransferase